MRFSASDNPVASGVSIAAPTFAAYSPLGYGSLRRPGIGEPKLLLSSSRFPQAEILPLPPTEVRRSQDRAVT